MRSYETGWVVSIRFQGVSILLALYVTRTVYSSTHTYTFYTKIHTHKIHSHTQMNKIIHVYTKSIHNFNPIFALNSFSKRK